MTLIVVPVAYILMDDIVIWLKGFYLDERFVIKGTIAKEEGRSLTEEDKK